MEENKEPIIPRMMYMNEAFQQNAGGLTRENNMHADRSMPNPGMDTKNLHSTNPMPSNGSDRKRHDMASLMENPMSQSGTETARDLSGKKSAYFQDSGNMNLHQHQPHHHHQQQHHHLHQQEQQHNMNSSVAHYHHQDSNEDADKSRPENDQKNFACTVCSRAFKRKDKLKRHTLIHTGEKSHICGMCSKAFARRDKLTRHMRTHTNDKAYMCSLCPKAFYDNDGLARHLKTHLGDKGYACSTCHKAFYDNDTLLRHMKTHDEKEPEDKSISTFKCNFCGKLFKQDHYLKVHIMTYHGTNDQSAS